MTANLTQEEKCIRIRTMKRRHIEEFRQTLLACTVRDAEWLEELDNTHQLEGDWRRSMVRRRIAELRRLMGHDARDVAAGQARSVLGVGRRHAETRGPGEGQA